MVIEAAAKIKMEERVSCQLRNGILGLDTVDAVKMVGKGLETFVVLSCGAFLGVGKGWREGSGEG